MYLIQPAIVEFQCGYHYRLKKLFGKKVKTIRRKNKFSACIRQSWQCACKLVLRAKEFMSAMHRCSDQAVQAFACPVYTVYWDDGNCYSAPDRGAEYCDDRVCLSVCLSVFVCLRSYLRNCTSDLNQCLCVLPMTVARSCSGGVVIRYVFPVLWMTSYLNLSWGCSTSPPGWGSEAHTQPWAWRIGIPSAGRGRSGVLLAVMAY